MYSLQDLINDLQKHSFEEFVYSRKYLIIPDNSCLFINGKLSGVTQEEREKIDNIIRSIPYTAVLGGKINDARLKDDAHLLELSRQKINLNVLSFGFDKAVGIMDRLIYIVFESDKIPGYSKVIHVDEFDCSLIVQTEEVLKLKNYFKRPITGMEFNTTKSGLLGKYSQWIEENPIQFNMMVAELSLNNITYIDYLNTIERLKYDDYTSIVSKIRPIVSEAQVVMRR